MRREAEPAAKACMYVDTRKCVHARTHIYAHVHTRARDTYHVVAHAEVKVRG